MYVKNTLPYKIRKKKWLTYISREDVKIAIRQVRENEFTLKKRIVVLCIKFKIFFIPEIFYRYIN